MNDGDQRPRRRYPWLRPLLLAILAAVLAVEAVIAWPRLSASFRELGDMHWGWFAACVLAVMVSFDSYAQVSRVLLQSAGVRCNQVQTLGLQFASNSVSQSFPGGQVLAPTLVFQRTRQWGATNVVAAWQIVMSGLLMSAGLAVLGVVGTLAAGAKTSPFSMVFSVGLLIVFFAAAQYISTRPDGFEAVGTRVLHILNRMRGKEEDKGVDKWRETLDQLGSVRMSRRTAATAIAWSLLNWVADVMCLAFACYAVGAHPGLAALCVAYAASKAVNSISPVPGGLGLVEPALITALTWAGMPFSVAISATFIYRLVSYFLVVVVGWVVFFVAYRNSLSFRVSRDEADS
ncbi:lysylphosphatidylglycerol synthase transmembrane domain-containing protein [Tsukamurella sp. 1534]|uniref:lysylphosphatidylglycerol synthase transmembrane domain-containing protein n=1 Tax=Tsukamurella sp. 1534 TaxID=1151061 RepID=UPI0002EB6164|nr:lysylphosphatidylglycerol synthase transmembrane domain-containing protein [Tsukamurella sp. 1534]